MKSILVGDVRSPVNLGIISFIDDFLNHVKVECLGQVLLDQGDPLLGRHLRHGGRSCSGKIGSSQVKPSFSELLEVDSGQLTVAVKAPVMAGGADRRRLQVGATKK